ncbi:MAG: hypothetical protein DRI77_10920 [Chloroflexi bacterium]|nr:MAG: hypothetical protein DRI77_10920 [Chloroflexota bacterium]
MNVPDSSDWSVEIQRRRVALLDRLLLTAVISGMAALILAYITLPSVMLLESMSVLERLAIMAPYVASWLVMLIAWLWRGLDYRIRALVLLLLAYIVGIVIFARGGLVGSGRIMLLLPTALAFVLLGVRPGVAAGAASGLIYAFFTLAISQKWVVPQVAEDLTTLSPMVGEGGTFVVVVVVLTAVLWSFSRGWIKALVGVSTANRQLEARTRELEETTEQLHQRTSHLQATADIAKTASSTLDLETLLTKTAYDVQTSFGQMGVHYVGLFLLDDTQQFAVLRAATGDVGRRLLEAGHRLEVGETSAVGWSIVHRQARIALDAEETGFFGQDLVSRTRSEIALPLHSRGHILGAISVQSTREAAFSEADAAVLQTMADQVAVAIDNARLFGQTEAALEEVQAAHRRYLAQAWKEFLVTKPLARIDYTQPGTGHIDDSLLHEARREVTAHGQSVTVDTDRDGSASTPQAALVVPLKLRGQTIGTIALHETRRQRAWTTEETILAETVAEQLALTVENLRLMDETQRRAHEERLLGEITARIRAPLDVDAILQTAVRELGQAIGVDRVSVYLAPEEEAI